MKKTSPKAIEERASTSMGRGADDGRTGGGSEEHEPIEGGRRGVAARLALCPKLRWALV